MTDEEITQLLSTLGATAKRTLETLVYAALTSKLPARAIPIP